MKNCRKEGYIVGKFWKRIGAAGIALVMCAGTISTVSDSMLSADASEVIFEAEFEDLETTSGTSPTIWTDIYGTEISGYSGDGFVYLTGDTITMTVDAPEEAMYEIIINCAQILDEDGRMQTISINDTSYTFTLPYMDTFEEVNIGRYRLQEGENTIEFQPIYGYAEYDYIIIQTADSVDVAATIDSDLCDENATDEAQSLMNYLTSVYGENIISGQQEIYGGGNDGDYELEFDYIYEITDGELPAMRGFDFMNYNPLYGWEDGTTDRVIAWVTGTFDSEDDDLASDEYSDKYDGMSGGIATACWHINIPEDFDSWEEGDTLDWTECSYEVNDSFSVEDAVIDGTKENAYLDAAIECLAEQFQILQDAGVPILFRPFHEAEGNGGTDGSGAWFWWGQDGAEAYKDLWVYLYEALTETYDLHNIIWVENLYAWSDESAEWYVGDEYVDIVGYDKYNTEYNRHDGNTSGPNEDAESSIYYSLVEYVDGEKMVSMPENDTIPSLENLEIEEAYWLYFMPWYGEHITSEDKNDPDTVKEMYQSEYCITLSELPADLYSGYTSDDAEDTSEETEEDTTEESDNSEVTTAYILGDFNLDLTVNGLDLALSKQVVLEPEEYSDLIENLSVVDVNQDETFSLADVVALSNFLLGN